MSKGAPIIGAYLNTLEFIFGGRREGEGE